MTNDPEPDEEQPRYLTRSQAATYLNVSEAWLARTGRGVVPQLKFGGHIRYDKDELDRWAKQQRAY